jgi:Predicted membrane protein (DUF2142)
MMRSGNGILMNSLDESKTFRNRNEPILIFVLCFVAAVRVFIFAAAFPFFSNVDEYLHFDLVTQYSHAHLPHSFDRLTEETLGWIVLYASPEFLSAPDQFPQGKFPTPLWKQTGLDRDAEIAATKAAWSNEINFESSQPPLYYVVASVWWWIGKSIGVAGIQSLYWIRFLNVPLIAIVVWMGYLTARMIAPECPEFRIGVPLLLAFIPENVFYAMNNDVLSPPCFGALFLCLLRWLRAEAATIGLGAVTGLAAAATYFTKLSNLPLILVALLAVMAKLLLIIRRTPRTGLAALAALVACAAIPIGSWMVWSQHQFGDPSGSTEKIMLLGWTRKPFPEWWQHPIFTPRGVWTFWSSLLASFWRGELSWHGRLLSWGPVDGFFALSSLILLGCAIVGLSRWAGLSAFQRQAIAIAILIFVGGIIFLALLSIPFDFGASRGPSRTHPYFTAGRLLSGALIPFAVAYVYGVVFLLRKMHRTVLRLAILAGLATFLATSEIIVNHVTFGSGHNWFHR